MTSLAGTSHVELVTLLDEAGLPCGTAPKAEVHHADTPLHLAFSCWVLDDAGRTLLTRRSPAKRTWPGIWTNSFCGHPGPGESPLQALLRRSVDELGARVTGAAPLLPDFRYRAVMADGTVENEVCPVFTARLVEPPSPDPDEVADLRWVPVADVIRLVAADPDAYSPWMQDQIAQLESRGGVAASLRHSRRSSDDRPRVPSGSSSTPR